jgi:predicted esterase
MRRRISQSLVFVVLLSCAACGGSDEVSDTAGNNGENNAADAGTNDTPDGAEDADDADDASDGSPDVADIGGDAADVPADTEVDTTDGGDPPCEPQRTAMRFEPSEFTVNGSRVLVQRPEAPPQGIMFVIHGTSGSAEVFFDRVEAALFVEDALARGMVIVSPESIDRGNPNRDNRGAAWEVTPTTEQNPDIANVVATLDRVHRLGISEDLPVYLVGGSNGGNMVAALAQVLEVRAAHIFISRAREFTMNGATVPPTFFVEARNDTTVTDEDGLPLPFEVYENLRRQGYTVEHRYNEPEAVTRGRFTRIPGVTCPQSIAVFRALEGHPGVLGDGGALLPGWEDSGWGASLPPNAAQYEFEIGDQLRELYAEHVPTAEFNAEVLDFMLGQ